MTSFPFPSSVTLTKVTRAARDNRSRGLSFEADWKRSLDPLFMVPSPGDTRFDGIMIQYKNPVDAKLIQSPSFYMSHREYLYACEHDTVYAGYEVAAGGETAELTLVLVHSDLVREDLVKRYWGGNEVWCEATGKKEAPWSVNIYSAKKHNLL